MDASTLRNSWLYWPQTQRLIEVFHQGGHEIRFVGGAVRDLLLGRPVHDVDVATPASPQQVMGLLEKAQIKVIPTGLSHGTVTALIDSVAFEITTLRADIKTYGRHAEVQFTRNWEEDAARRDFTLNALYCDATGKVYDYFDGLRDLHAHHVRFIGDPEQRIREDGLRILRFFRFSAYYSEGEVDLPGLEACYQCREMLDQLSGERIAQEMLKLMASDYAAAMLERMQEEQLTTSLFGYKIHPEPLKNWPRVKLLADMESSVLPEQDTLLPLVLLCRGQAESAVGMADFIIERWKLSNKQADLLRSLVRQPRLSKDSEENEQKRLIRHYGAQTFMLMVLMSWAEMMADTQQQVQLLSASYRSMLWLAEQWQPPVFPLKGSDLIAHGIKSGPELGNWLQKLEDWWEKEDYQPDRQALLERFKAQR